MRRILLRYSYALVLLLLIVSSLHQLPVLGNFRINGYVEVYFMPIDASRAIHRIIELINNAHSYVYLASFILDEKGIVDSLINASKRGLDVRVVSDSDTMRDYQQVLHRLEDSGISVRLDNRAGDYMHDKFIVIDDEIVVTGSTNYRDRSFYGNNNDLVIIHSQQVALNYKAEFLEMYRGVFGGGERTLHPVSRINGLVVEDYFSPEDHVASRIESYIERANKSILVAAYVFTNNRLANALVNAASRGVLVYLVVESYSLETVSSMKSLVDYMSRNGIHVYPDINPYTMHCKFFIIDDKVVITGSYNPTYHAEYRNDENIIIIHSRRIAEWYKWYYLNYLLPNGTRLIVKVFDNSGKPVSGAVVNALDIDTSGKSSAVTNSSGVAVITIPSMRPGHRVKVTVSVNGFLGGGGSSTVIVKLGPNNVSVTVERYNMRILTFIVGVIVLVIGVFTVEKLYYAFKRRS